MTGDADELRRRLYRPGATAVDVDAYRAALAERAAEPGPPPPPPPAPRRRWAVPVGAAAVAVVALALLQVLPSDPAAPPRTTASADVDTGLRALPGTNPLQTVPVDPAQRTAFIRALVDGAPAGVGLWLDRRAPDLPGALATATRSETIEASGDGDRTIRLSPTSLGDDGGHVTVLLVAAVDADGGWIASRPVRDADRTVHLASSAPRSGALRAGTPSTASFQYLPGERPTTLRVLLPDGVRWGVAVVFSD